MPSSILSKIQPVVRKEICTPVALSQNMPTVSCDWLQKGQNKPVWQASKPFSRGSRPESIPRQGAVSQSRSRPEPNNAKTSVGLLQFPGIPSDAGRKVAPNLPVL